MIRANFIPPERAQRSRTRVVVRAWGIGLSCLALLMAIILPAGHFALAAPDSRSRTEMDRTKVRTEAANAEGAQIAARLADLAHRIVAAETAGNHPDFSLLLGALARARGDDAVLTRISMVVSREASAAPAASKGAEKPAAARPAARPSQKLTITISGSASSPTKIYEFAQRLERLGVFNAVQVKNTRAAGVSQSTGSTLFELEAVALEPSSGAGGTAP